MTVEKNNPDFVVISAAQFDVNGDMIEKHSVSVEKVTLKEFEGAVEALRKNLFSKKPK